MSDLNTYTIARYDHHLGGGEAHGFYVLERNNSDGTTTPLAAIHGMSTGANGRPDTVGMPWSGDTIKGHLYMDQSAPPPGIVRPSSVPIGIYPEGTPPFPDGTPAAGQIAGPTFLNTRGDPAVRRADLGPMSQDQATARFNQMLQGAGAINLKDAGYDPAGGPNSNTFAKTMGEIAADPSIGKIDRNGQSLGSGGEYNKPAWGMSLLSPDEVRAINPNAGIVSYPQSGPLDSPQIRSVVTNADGSRTETYDDGSTGHFDASGSRIPTAPAPVPAPPPSSTSLPPNGSSSITPAGDGATASLAGIGNDGSSGTGDAVQTASSTDGLGGDTGLTDQDVADLTPDAASWNTLMNGGGFLDA